MLTQYRAASLHRHVTLFWQRYFCRERGEYADIAPPQQQIHETWYQGTADAVYQNLPAIEKERPEYVVILAGDHVYKMDYEPFLQHHIDKGRGLDDWGDPGETCRGRREFGVLEVDRDDRVTGFQEKPADPKPVPGDEHAASPRWASMWSPCGSCSISWGGMRNSRTVGMISAAT